MKRILASLYFCTLILLVATSSSAATIDELLTERLSYMKDVAAYKWAKSLVIEDSARETRVIQAAMQQGLRYQIDPASSQAFLKLQIEAAKEIQHYWFSEWEKNPNTAPTHGPDLANEIRPALILLGNKIITALANPDLKPETDLRNTGALEQKITVQGLSDKTAKALLDQIDVINRFKNHLDQILATGTIRVGTTGDYAPFSSDLSGDLIGIDIDMAKDLAHSLEVEIQWVETSWPTLMADLNAGKFDIAMSGISKNLKRQRTALFSVPYHIGGKAPIIRCEDAQKFQSMAKIDSPDTRLIVNPGGTNRRYVLQHIKQAQVLIHQDNRTIFQAISSGEADVMITDAIEVRLQSAKLPDLCPALGVQKLSYSEKAYLLPRDFVWQAYVNTWLGLRLNDSTIDSVFSAHLGPYPAPGR